MQTKTPKGRKKGGDAKEKKDRGRMVLHRRPATASAGRGRDDLNAIRKRGNLKAYSKGRLARQLRAHPNLKRVSAERPRLRGVSPVKKKPKKRPRGKQPLLSNEFHPVRKRTGPSSLER